MQYLLSEDEYTELSTRPTHAKMQMANEAVRALRGMVTAGNCIHESNNEYCDMCPLSDLGGHITGETRPSREMSKWMCPLPRSYSK